MAVANALDAYWNFFTTFNTRDPRAFSGALQYPHVRISPRRPPVVVPDLDTHAERQTWQPFIEQGWDHTVGAEPTVLHESDERAHIIGGWTRYTVDEKPLLTNHVCYIVTNGQAGWRIQSRFGVDGDASDTHHAVAADVVRGYLDAQRDGDFAAAAALMNFPALRIEVDAVTAWEDAEVAARALEGSAGSGFVSYDVQAVQGGESGVNVAVDFEITGRGRGQALVCVTRQDDHWGVQGRSIIAP